MSTTPDRSRDLSQPLDRLHPDETIKAKSNFLRGTIAEGLKDPITGAIPAVADTKLMKFHGIYQQDDRDLREERHRQKLEQAFQFMVRVRLPGGVCRPDQWLKLDEIARTYANGTLRLTTRQTFQLHGVLKGDMKPAIQGMHAVLLDAIAACGDVSRGVMSSVNPHLSAIHAQVYEDAKRLSDDCIPKTRAFHEIWLDEEKVAGSEDQEPLYGRTYLPRKFKIGFVIPPTNDIDVYTQDLGYIAIVENGVLQGYNISVGGGMGRTDNAPKTYPRLADVIGFIRPDQVIALGKAVMSIQRDFGDRTDRAHARFKYTLDDHGLDWFTQELATRLGAPLEPARPYTFTSNGDALGWVKGDDGRHHLTLFVESGRVANHGDYRLMDALRALARVHPGEYRITPNQNLTIANIPAAGRKRVEKILAEHGVAFQEGLSGLRKNSIACVALPTCGLAMAEAERYMPTLLDKLEVLLAGNGLRDEPITIRMSGCPNGCSRPYVAEIAFTGRAPGKYNVFLGGGFHGQRLNKMYLENVGEPAILDELGKLFGRFARERTPGEPFGDFVIRTGTVKEVTAGRHFND